MNLTEDILRAQQLLKWGTDLALVDEKMEDPDVLLIYAGLVTIEKAVQSLKSVYQDSATKLAKEELEKLDKESGSFKKGGFVFNISESDFFDFVGEPQKSHDETGTQYREEFYQQAKYKSLAQACTKVMKGLKDRYPLEHPNVKPERTDTKLSFQFAQTMKNLDLAMPKNLSDEPKVVAINDL